jgi:hypothetical protein
MTDYNLLHRIGVSISSYKNELSKAETLHEVITLANKVSELEKQVVLKRDEFMSSLRDKRVTVVKKIEELNKELSKLDKQYNSKIEWYKRQVKSRIDELDLEVGERKKELEK